VRRGKKRRTTVPDEKAVERIAMMIAAARILTWMTASGLPCHLAPGRLSWDDHVHEGCVSL
jgi:hypothetical protein